MQEALDLLRVRAVPLGSHRDRDATHVPDFGRGAYIDQPCAALLIWKPSFRRCHGTCVGALAGFEASAGDVKNALAFRLPAYEFGSVNNFVHKPRMKLSCGLL